MNSNKLLRCALLCAVFVSRSLTTTSVAEKPPDNHNCKYARGLYIGESISNTTEFASISDKPVCIDPSKWGSFHERAPSVWYTINGTGVGLTAYARPMPGRDSIISRAGITVYKGDCHRLQCLSVSHSDKILDFRDAEDEVASWFGIEGETYYILVQSLVGSAYQGPFQLEIRENKALVANDVCQNALPAGANTLMIGSLGFGSIDLEIPWSCRITPKYYLLGNTEGIWYQMDGTGKAMNVAPGDCSDLQDPYDYGISVFSGSCSNLTCLGWKRCDDQEREITVDSVKGETYYILVEGRSHQNYLDFEVIFSEKKKKQHSNVLPAKIKAIPIHPSHLGSSSSIVHTTAGNVIACLVTMITVALSVAT